MGKMKFAKELSNSFADQEDMALLTMIKIPTQFSYTFPILKVNTAPEKVIEYDTLYVQCHQDSTNHKGFASKSSISLLKFTKNGLKKKLRKSWPRIDLQSLKRKN